MSVDQLIASLFLLHPPDNVWKCFLNLFDIFVCGGGGGERQLNW